MQEAIVHCPTRALWDGVQRALMAEGCYWLTGCQESARGWEEYGEQACLHVFPNKEMLYGSRSFYEGEERKKIIPALEYLQVLLTGHAYFIVLDKNITRFSSGDLVKRINANTYERVSDGLRQVGIREEIVLRPAYLEEICALRFSREGPVLEGGEKLLRFIRASAPEKEQIVPHPFGIIYSSDPGGAGDTRTPKSPFDKLTVKKTMSIISKVYKSSTAKAFEKFGIGTPKQLNNAGQAEFIDYLYNNNKELRKGFQAKIVEAYQEEKGR